MSRADWTRDELILALDLYHRYGRLDDSRSEVVELSELLRKMAVHAAPPDPVRYRSPGSVAYKLSNIASIDPGGRPGQPNGSRLDQVIWDEFSTDWQALAREAERIRSHVS
jgi:5-methylcytosine-specific restriction enzyme A